MRARLRRATAGLMLLIVPLAGCGQQARTRREPAAAIAIEAIGPKGAVEWPVAFQWRTTARADEICRVTVFDEAERTLFQQDTRQRRLDAPDSLRPLAGPRRLSWRVAVLNDAGDIVVQSAPVEFALR